jgi:hypothetical protein
LLALTVERRGGFVEEQDARVGGDGARDLYTLALATAQLHAALADLATRHGAIVAV